MYRKIVLNNGLTLILDRRAMAKKAVLIVGLKVGSVNESDEIAGINHAIEHMLFKSNAFRTTKQIEEELEDGGADMNAFSDYTDMFFYIKSLPSKIPRVIEIIYQAATNLDFNEREFLIEKKTILSEISLWPEQPMNYSFDDLFFPTIFKNTPLERCVAGTSESVSALKTRDLVDFKARWYSPERMIILACGKFDEKEAIDKISETFGTLKRGITPVEEFKIRTKNRRNEVFKGVENIEHAYVNLGYLVPGMASRDIDKLRVLSGVLGGGFSSRLWQEIRDKRGLGYSVDCGVGGLKKVGVFSASLTLFRPTIRKIRMVSKIIINEFEKLKSDMVEERELQRAKDLIISGYYDEIERIESLALDMLESEILGIPYGKFKKFPIRIQAVSSEDLIKVANKYFTDKYTITALIPNSLEE